MLAGVQQKQAYGSKTKKIEYVLRIQIRVPFKPLNSAASNGSPTELYINVNMNEAKGDYDDDELSSKTVLAILYYVRVAACELLQNSARRRLNDHPIASTINQPPKSIEDMSTEILLHIFRYLKYEDLIKIIEEYSPEWREILSQHYWKMFKRLVMNKVFVDNLYNTPIDNLHVDLQNAKVWMSFNCVMNRISETKLTQLDLSGMAKYFVSTYEPYCIDVITKRCHHLTHLSLNGFAIFKHSTIQFQNFITTVGGQLRVLGLRGSLIADANLELVFTSCPMLEELDLHSCTRLFGTSLLKLPTTCVSLNLSYCYLIEKKNLIEMIKTSSQLRHLWLYHTYEEKCAMYLGHISKSLVNLETLQLITTDYDLFNFEKMSTNLSRLTFLNLRESIICEYRTLQSVLVNCRCLTTLILEDCLEVEDASFCMKPIQAPLVYLVLARCTQLTNNTLKALEACSKTLERLDIDGCTLMTNVYILTLFERFPKLVYLNVNNLQLVNNKLLYSIINANLPTVSYVTCVRTGVDCQKFVNDFSNKPIQKHMPDGLVEIKYANLVFLTDLKEKKIR